MSQKLNKISNYLLVIVLASIFIEIKFPSFYWVSTIAVIGLYVSNLAREKIEKGKIKLISIVLCIMAISWVLSKPYVDSVYYNIFGKIVVYSYLLNSQYQVLGQIKKKFLCYCILAVGISLLSLRFSGTWMTLLILATQMWIMFQYLDPILYKIAMVHREKRLAAEAERQQQEESSVTIKV